MGKVNGMPHQARLCSFFAQVAYAWDLKWKSGSVRRSYHTAVGDDPPWHQHEQTVEEALAIECRRTRKALDVIYHDALRRLEAL